MQSPMFKMLQEQMKDEEEKKKLVRKFTYQDEKDQIYEEFDERDEYDLEKLQQEFEKEGYNIGEWT